MTVIRNRHNSKQPFVILDKKTLWNEELSLGALGLWGRCISRPDNWVFSVKELLKKCKEGKHLLYKYFKELIAANLCIRIQHRCVLKKDGKIHMGAGPVEYLFFELPISAEERAKEIRETERNFVQTLVDAGYEFSDSKNAVATRRFKKSLLLSDSSEATPSDPMNQPITKNNSNKEREDQQTNTRGCSYPKECVKEETLQEFGIDTRKFALLRKDFSLDQILIAFEMLKKAPGPIKNPYGWLKRCISEDWAAKEKQTDARIKETISENMDLCLHVEKITYGKLKPGSSVSITKDSFIIISGEKISEFKYTDPKFKERIKSSLKRMNIEI